MRNHRRSSSAPAVFIFVIGLAASVFFAVRANRAEREAQATRAWTHTVMDSLGKVARPPDPPPGPEGRDKLYWEWVATTAQMQTRQVRRELAFWKERHGTLLDEDDLASLEAAGLEDPARQLRDSLVARPDLIPFRTETARPSFVRERVVLLGRPYAFAYFEDGRNRGYLLLEYDVQPPRRIVWRRLWAARLNAP